jgi:hypothetical protein
MQTATYTFWNLSEQWLSNFKVSKWRSHFAALKEFFFFFLQWVYIYGVLNEDSFANHFGHMLFQWLSCWWRLEHKPKKKQVIHSCTGFCRDELQVFSKDAVTCYLPPLLIASSSAHLDVFCVPFEPYDISWSNLSIFIFDLQFCILFNFFLGQSYEMHHLSVHHMTFVKIKCWRHVLYS